MFESHGPSLKAREKRERELHHISIFPGENATADNPSWLVTHHAEEDSSPAEEHRFQDGQKMLRHVAGAAGVPNKEGGE